jgi:hypothetical protein
MIKDFLEYITITTEPRLGVQELLDLRHALTVAMNCPNVATMRHQIKAAVEKYLPFVPELGLVEAEEAQRDVE